jgi:phosphoribosyl 1,2-cyclic phosphodiesterase
VDVGPEVLLHFERLGRVPHVDGVILTHGHPDHVAGIDDLVRGGPLRADGPLPVHVHEAHRAALSAAFPRLFSGERAPCAFLDWASGTTLEMGGLTLTGFETGHRAASPTTGVLFSWAEGAVTRRLALATDMGELDPSPREALAHLDAFVGDGTYLGAAGHGHPGTLRVAAFAREVGARRLAFAHVGHHGLADLAAQAALAPARLLQDGEALLPLAVG